MMMMMMNVFHYFCCDSGLLAVSGPITSYYGNHSMPPYHCTIRRPLRALHSSWVAGVLRSLSTNCGRSWVASVNLERNCLRCVELVPPALSRCSIIPTSSCRPYIGGRPQRLGQQESTTRSIDATTTVELFDLGGDCS